MPIRLVKIIKNLFYFFNHPSEFEIYTDGSSKNGVGSWAYVISKQGKCITEKSLRVRRANSNTMEFQAAIEALKSMPIHSKIKLFSDSRILIHTMNLKRGPQVHRDQIETLLALDQKHQITWHWVKAHHGNVFNERCDQLCTWARENRPPQSVP